MNPDAAVFRVIPVSRILMPRFTPSGRGCGMGYVQWYITNDSQGVAEGNQWDPKPNVIKKRVAEFIHNAERVIEKQSEFHYRGDHVGERIIIDNKPDESGKKSVSIIYYDGGDSYRFIEAPTEELAKEFEQYLIEKDFKSPF